VIDPQDANYFALFVHIKYDTVRLVENLPQSPGSQRRLDHQRAAARLPFQRKECIQQTVPPPFGSYSVVLLKTDILDKILGIGERRVRNINAKSQASPRVG